MGGGGEGGRGRWIARQRWTGGKGGEGGGRGVEWGLIVSDEVVRWGVGWWGLMVIHNTPICMCVCM
jgi:hypothetical protein